MFAERRALFMFSLSSVVFKVVPYLPLVYYRSFEIFRYCTPSATHLSLSACWMLLSGIASDENFRVFTLKLQCELRSHNRFLLSQMKALRCWFLNEGTVTQWRSSWQLTSDESLTFFFFCGAIPPRIWDPLSSHRRNFSWISSSSSISFPLDSSRFIID